MSVETSVYVGDVVLARHRRTGEEYFAYGELDDYSAWSFDEYPIGRLAIWREFNRGPYVHQRHFVDEVIRCRLGISEFVDINLDDVPDFAYKPVYVCNGITITTDERGWRWDRPDGYFYCFKEWYPEKTDDWKRNYYNDIDRFVKEFNCMQLGYTYWFCSARVVDVKDAYMNMLERLVSKANVVKSTEATAMEVARLFTGDCMRLKNYISDNNNDSCGGYFDEDYSEILKHYLDEQGLDFVRVVEPNIKLRERK